MIEELEPYSDYQPVDSRWIQRAPSHWEVKKLRALTTPRSERNSPHLPLLSVARDRGVFIRTEDDDNHNFVPDDLSNYKVARAGALVINKMKAWQGSMGIAPADGIVSPAYFVYDLRVSNRMFGQALLRSRPYVAHFAQASDGVRVGQWDLSINRMREIPVLLPPPEEQDAIVRFLDHANRRIDQFIHSKKRLIRAAAEAREVVTSDAMRDASAKHVRISSIAALASRPVVRERGVHYVKLGLRNRGRGIFHKAPELGEHLGDSDFFRVESGDLVISGQFAWEGAIAIASEAERGTVVSHRYPILRAKDGAALTPYLWAVLRSSYGDLLFDVHSRGAAGRNRPLNERTLLKEKIPVPSLEVQQRVTDFVAAEESVRRSVERALLPVLEYRTRLVSDIVTGQLDVRTAAAGLPLVDPESPPAESDGDEADIDDGEAE